MRRKLRPFSANQPGLVRVRLGTLDWTIGRRFPTMARVERRAGWVEPTGTLGQLPHVGTGFMQPWEALQQHFLRVCRPTSHRRPACLVLAWENTRACSPKPACGIHGKPCRNNERYSKVCQCPCCRRIQRKAVEQKAMLHEKFGPWSFAPPIRIEKSGREETGIDASSLHMESIAEENHLCSQVEVWYKKVTASDIESTTSAKEAESISIAFCYLGRYPSS